MSVVSQENIKILNEVGRWKAISLRGLFQSLGARGDYSCLSRRVKRLEGYGLLNGFFESRHGKYLTLTDKGAELSIYPSFYRDAQESVNHDLICSNAILKMLGFKLFDFGSAIDYMDSQIGPDGVIHAQRYGEKYVLAIEIELHQKSKRRVVDKFSKYLQEPAFDHVLYITSKRNVFDAYMKILGNMKDQIRKKIALELDETLSPKVHDYENAIYWMNGKYKIFQEMFGETK